VGKLRCVASYYVGLRDGNGDPILDSLCGILLLGEGDGEVSSPRGCKRRKILPRRVNGDGDGKVFPIPVPPGPIKLTRDNIFMY
jgi:hypothetical protein